MVKHVTWVCGCRNVFRLALGWEEGNRRFPTHLDHNGKDWDFFYYPKDEEQWIFEDLLVQITTVIRLGSKCAWSNNPEVVVG